ncbi:hypothetical protein [Sulfolobus acidocaldarius]|uniref:Uncharacterized protein n=4 Tax=Sulfolobus acidocaldarius TaxID=2285 RepID=Q4J722_SULAC|nr:hypothetical protein [Sulfolobus acidocaldarius]AAY81409.1 hypothetical protein Saci_2115 [Sulfolobus acidocaldarius DSM 639]AGE72008.1 hypothetical protein SacN8_10290 [Sulfolobus acidocaldarius N8]AGE74325.1 hypothetical protein SacRon12I_10545 [Sulfolobus acidocaldarius Ron12/I]ALU29799.1 hypothetical protein ATY89_07510 [Sulfolobus acidocaldarius]ALU32538.1 hypothetical protein ATZ20_10530 [Sulfolobus acidocaldarius]
MKYANFWIKFKNWAINAEDKDVPLRLREVVRVIKENPEISVVKLAAYFDSDALFLARSIYFNYKKMVQNEVA